MNKLTGQAEVRIGRDSLRQWLENMPTLPADIIPDLTMPAVNREASPEQVAIMARFEELLRRVDTPEARERILELSLRRDPKNILKLRVEDDSR